MASAMLRYESLSTGKEIGRHLGKFPWCSFSMGLFAACFI